LLPGYIESFPHIHDLSALRRRDEFRFPSKWSSSFKLPGSDRRHASFCGSFSKISSHRSRGNYAYAYSEKAWALDALERYQEAYDAAKISVGLDNTDGRPYNSLADAAYVLGRYDEAMAAGNRHCELHETCSVAFEQRALIHEQLGHVKGAELDRQHAAMLDQKIAAK
jgi:hypothetical protein